MYRLLGTSHAGHARGFPCGWYMLLHKIWRLGQLVRQDHLGGLWCSLHACTWHLGFGRRHLCGAHLLGCSRHLMSRAFSKQLRYADETSNAHALLVRFLCTDMQHSCSSVGFYFQRLLINRILCISLHGVGEFMETVHICIRWLARERFVWAMQSAGVDFFWLYADTSQSEDFDLKLHCY